MDWNSFNSHGESKEHAFEVMCNIIFREWCKQTYGSHLERVMFINGSGGDGGVEAYASLNNGKLIGVQSKWFRDGINPNRKKQILGSFKTAIEVRPSICEYIVCIPRNLGSLKIGRGNRKVENTEEEQWNSIERECKELAPNVKITLWDETTIQYFLTLSQLRGCYSFWFENSVVFDEIVEMAFQKSVSSWASKKNIPELYAEGYVHQRLDFFLGSYMLTERRAKELEKILKRLSNLKLAYEDLINADEVDLNGDKAGKIQKDIDTLNKWIVKLDDAKDRVFKGDTLCFDEPFELEINTYDPKGIYFSEKFNHHYAVRKGLENLIDDFYDFKRLLEKKDINRLVITGNQGTGKTVAVISEANRYLNDKTHLPIIVRAKDFDRGNNWNTILKNTLALSPNYGEAELFSALICLTNLRKTKVEREYDFEPKCVIFVDGIDEGDREFWKEKIKEVEAYREKYPEIRFVFLSRPNSFDFDELVQFQESVARIPDAGDVLATDLCDKYFDYYKINIGKNRWIKKLFRTPFSLWLFCDIYRGKTILKVERNTAIITELYKKKMSLLDKKFSEITKHKFEKDIAYNSLLKIAEFFESEKDILSERLSHIIRDKAGEQGTAILSYLEEEGFIYSYIEQKNEFGEKKVMYSWGSQPAFEYLLARKIYEAIERGELVSEVYDIEIYHMLSMIVVEEKQQLLSEFSNVELEEDFKVYLDYYALANAPIQVAEKYREKLRSEMLTSPKVFREVVNQVVIPSSTHPEHPLGARFLDDFLMCVKKPAIRDIWWSIPGFLNGGYADWKAYTDIQFDSIEIDVSDDAFSSPLILAWSLASVDNTIRLQSRKRLTVWGIENSEEFWKLLVHFSRVNDEQIIEDLFAIAFGISLAPQIDDYYLRCASEWILKNVFSKKGLSRYENVCVRYYCSGIVKIAIAKALVDEKNVNVITPPYEYESTKKLLAKKALKSKAGFVGIDYDMSAYVLGNHYLNGFFERDYRKKAYSKETRIFIDACKREIDRETLTEHEIVLAMAYRYLLNTGWKAKLFYDFKNTNLFGIDLAIQQTYSKATHGSMSNVMTVAEKNVWLARHKIASIFANLMPFRSYETDSKPIFIDDYSLLEVFVNPYQDIVNDKWRGEDLGWIHKELLAMTKCKNSDYESIESWMKEIELPEFETWIFRNDGMVLLESATNVCNERGGIEEAVFISSGAVRTQDFEKFLKALNCYSEVRADMMNSSGNRATYECRSFCTPLEACTVRSNREIESFDTLKENGKNIKIVKMAASCLSSEEIKVEKEFVLPSRFVRETLGIVSGDGYNYIDKYGNVIAVYKCNSDGINNYQRALLINEKELDAGLKRKRYRQFWTFRVYRCPSSKAYEKYGGITHHTEATYVVWKENNKIKYVLLEEIEPPEKKEPIKTNVIFGDDGSISIVVDDELFD